MEATKIKIKGTSYDLADAGLDALKTVANTNKSVIINSDGDGLSVAEKADLASPAFTGTPTAPTAATATDTTQIATTAFAQALVNSKLSELDALIYKGAVNSDSDLPYTSAKVGWTYKVATAGTYDSKVCEVGDMLICRVKGTSSVNAQFDAIQGNIDGAVIGPVSSVDAHIVVFNGATGKLIKDSGALLNNYLPVSGGTAANLEVTGTLKADLSGNCSGSSESCNGLAASASTLTGLTATVAELNYSVGVTSNIQTQLDAKQASLPTTSAAGKALLSTSTEGTYEWGDNGKIDDVKVNGTSVVTDKVANIDLSNYVPNTRTVNDHALSANITVTASDVGLGNVNNTSDSATPVSGGTTKFTTGGAYTELAKKVDIAQGSLNANKILATNSSGNVSFATNLIFNDGQLGYDL